MEHHQRRLFYTGTVQGVGFRARTKRLATAYQLSGFVRNLPDGRVELLVRGPIETIQKCLQGVQESFANQIAWVESEPEPWDPDGPTSFTIRHDLD